MKYFMPTLLYLAGIFITIDILITEYHVDKHCVPYEGSKDPKPVDMWIALFWPILLVEFFFKIVLFMIHAIFAHILLIFGIYYIRTHTYARIQHYLF
jgi:hypothetical protein